METTTTTTATEPNIDSTNTNTENNSEVKISKNQQKRLLKTARWEQFKDQKKQYMREKKKENLKKRKETMTSEEKLERGRLKKLKRKNEFDNLQGEIIFDFEMSSHMGEKEKKSLVTQMTFLHGFNKVSSKPMNLIATGVNEEMKTMLEKSSPLKMLKQYETAYIDTFKKEDLVYLTSDSPNVIQELDLSKKYIIGAIVDHNRLKGITFEKAQKQGIAHAQLPIGEYIQMASRKVLAVNHVFQIINQFLVVGNWKDAFESVIPKRKFEEMGRKKRSKLNKLNNQNNGDDEGEDDEEESEDNEGEENNNITTTTNTDNNTTDTITSTVSI